MSDSSSRADPSIADPSNIAAGQDVAQATDGNEHALEGPGDVGELELGLNGAALDALADDVVRLVSLSARVGLAAAGLTWLTCFQGANGRLGHFAPWTNM